MSSDRRPEKGQIFYRNDSIITIMCCKEKKNESNRNVPIDSLFLVRKMGLE